MANLWRADFEHVNIDMFPPLPIAHFLPNEWCICAAAVWSQPQTSLQSFWNMKGATENRLSATERCRKKINKYRQVIPDINLLTHGEQWGEELTSWSQANRSTQILEICCSRVPAWLKNTIPSLESSAGPKSGQELSGNMERYGQRERCEGESTRMATFQFPFQNDGFGRKIRTS